jgi:hypothetical protein
MPRRRRDSERSTNWFVPIVVSVVMGSVAFAVSDTVRTGRASDESQPASSTASVAESASSTRIHVGIRVPKADRDQLFSVDTAFGESVPVDVEQGWRVEALNEASSLRLVPHEERGVTLTDGDEWNVVLRAPTGEAYTEPRLLGMFDDRHAAIVARTDRYHVLSVSRSGSVASLGEVPEYGTVIGFSGGAAWISTFAPGEGIESEPSGPSTLLRIKADGTSEEVGTDEAHVIVGVVSDGARHAYWHDEGFVATMDGRTFSGTGRPLVWFASGELVVAKGVTLLLYRDGNPETLQASLPAAPVAARVIE